MGTEDRIRGLLAKMTLAEKVGQMCQLTGDHGNLKELVRQGRVGSILNLTGAEMSARARVTNEIQRLAVEESRLGIPIIIGRDVIHGFRTVMPIPLGQAASFDMPLVEQAAAAAAREASACGYRWSFAPMVDIARDPRWGRIAEGGGEDPVLTSRLGAAVVRGFQGADPSHPERIAACAKHYVGYGAAEGGRDYNTTWIPEGLLRDVYLPSFHACAQAGALTFMSSFNDLNGLPASANPFVLRQVLRKEWGFRGFVVSDWAAVEELIPHGLCADRRQAAATAALAGTDMEMVTSCFADHLEALVNDGVVPIAVIDEAVANILRVKLLLGLFDHPYTDEDRESQLLAPDHLELARRLAAQSCVLLKNDGALPLSPATKSVAVIGPLADAPADQLGCWAFDGLPGDTVTPLRALQAALKGRCQVRYAAGLESCRSDSDAGFAEARRLAADSEAAVMFLGEDALLSGEAHSRAFLNLPGAQEALARVIAETGRPVSVVVMAGRPLVLTDLLDCASALLYAWHPGTMGGPALADLLLGHTSPSGKLPVTFPRTVGQIPLYYSHKNTGRPPVPSSRKLPMGTPLNPEGFLSSYLDVDHEPLFPFGYGLSYARFTYSHLKLSSAELPIGGAVTVTATVTNTGKVEAEEVAQLYVRDLVGSVTRPVRELKDFCRVRLAPGESREVSFTLHTDQLAFHNAAMQRVVEPGLFHIMVGGNSEELLTAELTVV
ncbi:MAG: glycoside hydrolase family 3 N-terminal domain-containing protein [Armatimonadota bacterium]